MITYKFILTQSKVEKQVQSLFTAIREQITELEKVEVGREVFQRASGTGQALLVNPELPSLCVELVVNSSKFVSPFNRLVKYIRDSEGRVINLLLTDDGGMVWTAYRQSELFTPSTFPRFDGTTIDSSMFSTFQEALNSGYVTLVCD